MKPLTHVVVLSSLLLATTANVVGYFDNDTTALNRLEEYAAEADVAQTRYDALHDVWVRQVGDKVMKSKAYEEFSAEQVALADTLVGQGRAATESDALDGFRLFWNRKSAEPLIAKVRRADDIHAANSGINSLITMATATCEGTVVAKDQYATSGLDTAAGVATYEAVVKAWDGNTGACAALTSELERVAAL